MKRFFHAELEQFRSNLLMMGERCMEAVRLANRAVLESDVELAREAISKDDAIDELELRIDAEAIRYISMRSPVARDLRMLVMGMKAAHDLERVGDEATSIARRAIKLDAALPVKDFLAIQKMATSTLEMLRDSIDSLIDGDAEKAILLPPRDKEIDRLNKQNYAAITEQIKANPDKVDTLFHLLFVSKSLERIADHAANIAEEVVYLYKAEDIRHTPLVKEGKTE